MKYFLLGLFTLILFSLSSCELGPESPTGFSLPKGDIESGKLVLFKYQCLSCHQIAGIETPLLLVDNPKFSIRLGGKSIKVKTYADLLTSVINPSHKFAQGYHLELIQQEGVSNMTVYNDVMTVSELVNLVAFLQSNYELVPYRSTNYQFYGY